MANFESLPALHWSDTRRRRRENDKLLAVLPINTEVNSYKKFKKRSPDKLLNIIEQADKY